MISPEDPMKPSANELLLALRSPRAGWLATLVCALDEALRDDDFDPHQRELLRGLLETGHVPTAVAKAAEAGVCRFEQELCGRTAAQLDEAESSNAQSQRPKLTLVGSAVA